MTNKKTLPTVPQATQFQGMFDYLNKTVFNSELHSCMLVFSRNANIIGGYFSPEKWINEESETKVHEIGLNANIIKDHSFLHIVNIIIHEMIHLEQYLNGTHSRAGYHNKGFIKRCEDIGLKVEGKGQMVSTSIKQGGLAEQVALDMPEELIFDWTSNELHIPGEGGGGGGGGDGEGGEPSGEGDTEQQKSKPKSGKRSTYQCPVCGCKVWGKPGMIILCGTCDTRRMIESN